MPQTVTPLTITPLSARFGAEISGLDITRPLDQRPRPKSAPRRTGGA